MGFDVESSGNKTRDKNELAKRDKSGGEVEGLGVQANCGDAVGRATNSRANKAAKPETPIGYSFHCGVCIAETESVPQ